MSVEKLIERLQESTRTELGEAALVYMLIDDELYELDLQTCPKGNLGPGSVLLRKGKKLSPG